MRRLLALGTGLTLALSGTAPVLAQQPEPAVRLGKAVPLESQIEGPVVRGASPDSSRAGITPLFRPRLTAKTQSTTPPAGSGAPAAPASGSGTTLPPPRPLEGSPNVTEQRNPQQGTGTPMQPGASLGAPYPYPTGSPTPYPGVPFGPGIMPNQNGAYNTPPISGPIIGQTFPAAPSYPSPVMNTGGSYPMPVGQPIPVASPIHPDAACEPGYGYVAPAAPTTIAGDGLIAPQPRLADPYWGPGDPFFPVLRNALNTTFTDNRLTLGGEYLLWFVRAQSVPPLLTTSSPAFNGIIGQGDTRVIYGNQTPTDTRHSGARFSALYQINERWGVDGNIWFLGRNGTEFRANSDQYPVLARPFFNVNSNANSSELIASPNLSTGAAAILSETSLWGSEVNFRRGLLCAQCARLDALVGFRYLNLSETLQITETFQRTPNSNTGIGVPTVTGGTVQDRFRTENNFYGVNVGLSGQLERGWWFMRGHASVGLGSIYQRAELSGSQALNTNTGGVTTAQGGLLVLPGANLGTFNQTKFGVVPDVGVTLGLNLTDRLKFGVGYNLIYVNSVVRPAGQIDTGLDVRRIPNFPLTPAPAAIAGVRPTAFPLKTSDFFAQGLTFSLFWTW